MAGVSIQDVLSRLNRVKARSDGRNWDACCPAHEDQHASLSVGVADDGTILLKCHRGCDAAAIVRALGITLADLFPSNEGGGESKPATARRIIACYDYRDEAGCLVYQSVRYEPKDFRQRRPRVNNPRNDVGDDWTWNLQGVPRVLYRLPELLAADPNQRVFVVEGEKDADRLASLGLVATTNVGGGGGAGKWLRHYNEAFRGRKVVILPDNDQPGKEHGADVLRQLTGFAASVHVLNLPELPPKGDVSDWLNAGWTTDELLNLATLLEPTSAKSESEKPIVPILVQLSQVQSEPVEWLWPGWIPDGTLSILDGDPGLGKSSLTLDLAARVSRGWCMPPDCGIDGEREPGGVLLLGAEDSLKHTVRPRLDAAGADPALVFSLDGFRVGDDVRDPILPADLQRVEAFIRAQVIRLVIVDPLMAFLGGEVDPHKDHDIRRCLRPLRDLAERLEIAVLLLRHLNKLNGGPAMYRGGGSVGMIGAARAALIVGRDPADPKRHVLAMNKLNLGPVPQSLAYTIEPSGGVARIGWQGTTDLTKEDILWHGTGSKLPKTERAQFDEAKDFLTQLLANGPVAVAEIQENAKAFGMSWTTVTRARADLSVKTFKDGARWFWELPD